MLIEILVFSSSVLFLFHLVNALNWFFVGRKKQRGKNPVKEGFSILVPCYNEEKIIEEQIRRLRQVDYPKYEVVLVDDGSTDGTFQKMQEVLQLTEILKRRRPGLEGCRCYRARKASNVYVIKKKNSGKGASLNAAIEFAHYNNVITLDADSYLAPGALDQMNDCFADETVIAAGGSIHILQGGRQQGRSLWNGILISLQMLDYMKGFYVYKLSLARQNATAIISGAFGVFRKRYVQQVGGFRTTLGEDIDLTLKLQLLAAKQGKKIAYLPEALCYTQCPETLYDLTRQRMRWQKGFIDCVVFFWRSLGPSLFRRSLAFHFYIEAFLTGTLSAVFSFCTVAYLIVFHSKEALIVYGIYFLMRISLRILYGLIALTFARKLHGTRPVWNLSFVLALLLDLFVYGWYLMAIYVLGTLQYFWQGEEYYKWNKVTRNDII